MLKPCLASEMLVTRLNFKRVGDSISCEIDGQDFQRSSGSAELSQFLAALGRSARTASDSMLIISGLEHCVADLGDGYATLKFAASEDRGFQRVFAEVSPESAHKLGLGVLTRSNAYNLSSVDIGADPALAADIRASLAQRRASAPSAAAPSTASPPPAA